MFDENNDCASGLEDPLFHVPGGVSGSAEYPGGDLLITLGLWDNTNFVGSDFGIASTTMHELGHTLDLGHGGTPLPNCKPNYLSVMNYSFQLGGLIDINGIPHLDYSESALDPINEASGGSAFPGAYQTSWYAPTFPGDPNSAKRYCSGQKFDPNLSSGERGSHRRRFRFGDVVAGLDWNANGWSAGPGRQFRRRVRRQSSRDSTTGRTFV